MVDAVNQHITRQGVAVQLAAGGINPPVFGDANAGVQAGLLPGIPLVGGFGSDFQSEVRRLARFPDHIAVALPNGVGFHAGGHVEIRPETVVHVVLVVIDEAVGTNQDIGPAGEMPGHEVAALVDGGSLLHIAAILQLRVWIRAHVIVGQHDGCELAV